MSAGLVAASAPGVVPGRSPDPERVHFVERDAATVYAEGVLSGLRAAASIVGKHDSADIPKPLQAAIRRWWSNVEYFRWLHEEGRPASEVPSVF